MTCCSPLVQGASQQSKRLSDTLRKGQLWTGVWSITLVEGQDLPEDSPGDVFVRFKLGDQKFKSKVTWQGQFAP